MAASVTHPPETDLGAHERPGPAPVTDGRRFGDRALFSITAALTLPLLWLGYGTDIDIPALLATGDVMRGGDYAPSRNPGVPVFETVVALLDPIGGHIAINLATAAALAAVVIGIARLVQAAGHRNGDLIALAFLVSPLTLIAGTSTGDFIWALAFVVWGTLALWRDRSVLAGVLFALAVGSRSSSLLLVGALLVAEAWTPVHRRRAVTAGAVVVPLSVLLYVPAWLAFDRTFEFLTHTEGFQGLGNNLGRALYKNYAAAGIALVVVVAVLAPALLRALTRWNRDVLLRSAVLALLVTEGLFLLVPWKGAHLLPCLLALLLWVATTDQRRGALWLLIGAIALNGVVAFRPLQPDRPDESRSARFEPAITPGLLVNDIDCRVQFMDQPPVTLPGKDAWACSLRPMRGPSTADDARG